MATSPTTLIVGDDSIARIRRSISDWLKLQSVNQQAIAQGLSINPAPWDFRVFEEASNPIGTWMRDDFSDVDRRPIVNVSYSDGNANERQTTVLNQHSFRSLFHVDCYALGVAGNVEGGDTNAGLAATWISGLVRRLLFCSQFAYLGLRGLVQSRLVSQITTFIPAVGDVAVERVRCVRMTIEVVHVDKYDEATGEPLEQINLSVKEPLDKNYFGDDYETVLDNSGEVVFAEVQLGTVTP